MSGLSKPMQDMLDALPRLIEMGDGSYMPYQDQMRTINALERRGLIRYQRVTDGHKQNGYVLTTTPESN